MIGVLTGPASAFGDIARRPRWLPPLLTVLLSSLLVVFLFNQRVGWDRYVNNVLARHPRMEQLPAEQRERVLDQQRKILPYMGWIGPLVAIPLGAVVIAAVLLGVFNVTMNAAFKFKNSFSIVCYSWMPGVLHSLLVILIMYVKDPDDFDIERPSAFNVGSFLPDPSPKWLEALGGSLDLFSIWTIILLAFGFQALDRKRPFGTCLMSIVLPWAVYVIGKMAWRAVLG